MAYRRRGAYQWFCPATDDSLLSSSITSLKLHQDHSIWLQQVILRRCRSYGAVSREPGGCLSPGFQLTPQESTPSSGLAGDDAHGRSWQVRPAISGLRCKHRHTTKFPSDRVKHDSRCDKQCRTIVVRSDYVTTAKLLDDRLDGQNNGLTTFARLRPRLLVESPTLGRLGRGLGSARDLELAPARPHRPRLPVG